MNTGKYDPKRQQRLTYITVVLVILAGMISSFLRKDGELPSYLTFHNEGYMTIADATGKSEDIHYVDILSAEYVEAADFGTTAGGSILNEELRLGVWSSEAFGTYTNCTDIALGSCVFIRTENGAYAISYESDETTRTLQAAILDARARLLMGEEAE